MSFGKVEELLVVLVIILVLFGAKKLPELAKGIGQSVKEVRKGFREESSEPVATQTSTNTQPKA